MKSILQYEDSLLHSIHKEMYKDSYVYSCKYIHVHRLFQLVDLDNSDIHTFYSFPLASFLVVVCVDCNLKYYQMGNYGNRWDELGI